MDSDRKAAVPEASAESSPSAPTDPRPTEERAVLAAYEGMWRELAVAVQKASEEGTRIEDYASGEALATVRRDVRTMREAGTRANG
ncbi:putative secreted protein/lipoprotein [Streptomyces sp. FR-008]|nr:putative secreted protein/lipoprotein [Streptomyces sp. FR-008]